MVVEDSDHAIDDADEPDQSPAEPPTAAPATGPGVSTEPPRTGEPSVDAAIDRLRALDEVPVSEHVDVFDEAHRQLQDALADLDED